MILFDVCVFHPGEHVVDVSLVMSIYEVSAISFAFRQTIAEATMSTTIVVPVHLTLVAAPPEAPMAPNLKANDDWLLASWPVVVVANIAPPQSSIDLRPLPNRGPLTWASSKHIARGRKGAPELTAKLMAPLSQWTAG